MKSLWKRLNRPAKGWLLLCAVILFGLYQTGWDDDYQRPDWGFDRGWNSGPHPHSTAAFFRGLEYAVTHHFTKGTEERLYLHYANLFTGNQHDIAAFEEHRGNLGAFEELLLPPPHHRGPVLPYVDIGVEYPPVNIPFIVAPRLLVELPFDYYTLYGVEMGLVALFSLLLGLRIGLDCLELEPEQVTDFLKFSAIGLVALGNLFTTRLDLILTLFLMGGLLVTFQRRVVLAGVLLSLAAGAKLFPLLLVPLFVSYFYTTGEPLKAWRFFLSWTVTTGLIFIPFAVLGGQKFWVMFWFHGARPIQIESTYSAFILMKDLLFGGPATVGHFQGSFNLVAPHTEIYKSISTLAMLLGSIGVAALYHRAARKASTPVEAAELLIRATLSCLLVLMLVSKVFSPQYLIWLWPLAFLIWQKDGKLLHLLTLATFVLTQFLFPIFYGDLVLSLSYQGILVLFSRNFTLLILLYLAVAGIVSPEYRRRHLELFRTRTGALGWGGIGVWAIALIGFCQYLGMLSWLSNTLLRDFFPLKIAHALPLPAHFLSLDHLPPTVWRAWEQVILILLGAALYTTLRTLGLKKRVAVPLALCVAVGPWVEILSAEVGMSTLGAALGLVVLTGILTGRARVQSLGLLLLCVIRPPTPAVPLVACFVSRRDPRKAILPLLALASTVGWSIGSPPVIPLSFFRAFVADPLFDIIVLCGLLAFWYSKEPGEMVVKPYFACSAVLTLLWIKLGYAQAGDLLELKAACLLMIGLCWREQGGPNPRWAGVLSGLALTLLVLRNPYQEPDLGYRRLVREVVGKVQDVLYRHQPVYYQNSRVFRTGDQPWSGVAEARYNRVVLEDEKGIFDREVPPRNPLPYRQINNYWKTWLRKDPKTFLPLWKNYKIEALYPPLVLFRPKTVWEKEAEARDRFDTEDLPLGPDAVCQDHQGRLYMFKGSEYWVRIGRNVPPSNIYPRSIKKDWPGVPDDLDAALYHSGKFYYFKDDLYYRWNFAGWELNSGFPRKISEGWPGLPDNLQAAAMGPGEVAYFFKDGRVWAWDTEADRLMDGYPRPWTEVLGNPDQVDAVTEGRVPGDLVIWSETDKTVKVSR